MAERLENFDFTEARTKYPWHEWADGSTWRLVHGEDFTNETKVMRSVLYKQAREKGLRVRVHRDGDDLIFRFEKRED